MFFYFILRSTIPNEGASARKLRSKQSAIHPRTPDPYEESSKRQFDGRVKAWRRDLHKWDVMDNIEKVAVPLNGIANNNKSKEVESGEVVENGSSGFGSWAKKVEPATATVLAPVQILSANVKRANKKEDTTIARSSGDASLINTTVDSPEAKPAVSYLIGEDVEGLDGIDYDCEAPDDGDEDVL